MAKQIAERLGVKEKEVIQVIIVLDNIVSSRKKDTST